MIQRTKEKLLEDISLFVSFLTENKYILEKNSDNDIHFWYTISGNNIYGFIDVNFEIKNYSNDDFTKSARIFIDNEKCYDKQWKCPFNLKIPTPDQFDWYLKRLQFWGTKEGFDVSNNYEWYYFDTIAPD